MEGLVMAAQIILSLSILVGLHELGHLLAAKAFGMRVEQFSIGFPPRLFGVKFGDTDYSIGAIPLGGFVKISGMIDESLDTNAMKEPPKDYEFRSKPAWQRLIVMMGGIIVNVILGVVIFILLTYYVGENFIATQDANKYGIVALEYGQKIGLETGDRIIKINGEEFSDFGETQSPEVLLGDNSYYTIERGGKELDIFIPGDLIEQLSDRDARNQFIDIRSPFTIGIISEDGQAAALGMQVGDRIVSIDSTEILYFNDFQERIQDYENMEMPLTIEREGQLIPLTAKLDSTAKLGFYPDLELAYSHRDYTFSQSIPIGTRKAFSAVWVNAKALGKIFKGEMNPSKSLMGPIRIATEVFGGTWNWERFWGITGLLSMVLAFMNFLPIPALDGGHVMFLTFEIISGRKPSDKFLEVAQKVGMMILLLLMGFVIFNDIFRTDFIQNLIGG